MHKAHLNPLFYGRNPKYVVQIHVAVTKVEGLKNELAPQSLIMFQGNETEVLQQLGRLPDLGEIVTIESFTREEQPRILPIYKIKFTEQQ